MCPGIKGHKAKHIECRNRRYLNKKQFFQCLDRSDIGPAMFRKTIFRKETAELPNLSIKLDYNDTGIHCNDKVFLDWTRLHPLYYGIDGGCLLKDGKRLESEVLMRLLVTDLSFEGRRLIPPKWIKDKM